MSSAWARKKGSEAGLAIKKLDEFARIDIAVDGADEVDPRLEMTEVCDRVLKAGGPAILFEQPKGSFRAPSGGTIPVLGNLFGTPGRVARGMGADPVDWARSLREVGKLLAFLKEPEPPKSLKDAWQNTRPVFMKVMDMAPKEPMPR